MQKTLEEQFLKIIGTKRELAMKISVQMQGDAKAKVIAPLTVQQNSLALDNFDASTIALTKGDYEKSLHFFSRACANMGEFKGRSDKERGLS